MIRVLILSALICVVSCNGAKRLVPLVEDPPAEGFLLATVKELVFRRGDTARRLNGPSLDAMRCEGKHCSHVSVPEAITCINLNKLDQVSLPLWECTGLFQGGYKLDKLQVTCERMPDSKTLFVKDSCRLVYTLVHPDPAVEGHNEDGQGRSWFSDAGDVLASTPFLVCFGFVCVASGISAWMIAKSKSKDQ